MRKDDIPLLISHFIHVQNKKTGKKIKSVTQSSMRILMDYDWPGNVRELENAIEHAFVLCTGEHIDVFDLPVEIRQLAYKADFQKDTSLNKARRFSGKDLTPEILLETLHDCDWNKAEVGRRLGVSRTAIWKYMKKWDITLQKPG
jgi:DNA-binding NtrC family response regulator